MDHNWVDAFLVRSVYAISDQIDQQTQLPNVFAEMDEIQMPSLPGQDRVFMEPSEFNMPKLNSIQNSSGFSPQQPIGCSGSIARVESDCFHAVQGIQICSDLNPKVSALAHFLNSNEEGPSNFLLGYAHSGLTEFNSQAFCQKQRVKSPPKSSSRKVLTRNPTQREIHIMSERQRREEMNEKFSILRSILPGLIKKDKASIITHTMKYLVELEKKVKCLRACKVTREKDSKFRNKSSSCSPQIGFGERVGNMIDGRLQVDDNQSFATSSKKIGGDLGDEQSPQIEVQNLGSQAVVKIICPWSSGLVLRTHKVLDNCKMDLLQSSMTTYGSSVVHYFTIELNPGASSSIDKLMSDLQQASSST